MTFLVVDASVAIEWFVLEAGTDLAIRLLDTEATLFIAPDIFPVEVANGLLKQWKAGDLADDLLDKALVELERVMPQIVPSVGLLPRAIEIARRPRHPVYDLLYLALAERWETVFVTADDRLIKLCRRHLVGDPLLDHLRSLQDAVR